MGDVTQVKETYTVQAWKDREQYYIEQVSKIVLPATPQTRDVMKLEAEIDSLLSEAMLDAAYIRRKFQYLETKMKLYEKEMFSMIKQSPPKGLVTTKLTENDIKGFVVKYIKTHPLDNSKVNIYMMVKSVEERLIFIDAVVKMLYEKKGALIIDNGMLKIETSINGGNTP